MFSCLPYPFNGKPESAWGGVRTMTVETRHESANSSGSYSCLFFIIVGRKCQQKEEQRFHGQSSQKCIVETRCPYAGEIFGWRGLRALRCRWTQISLKRITYLYATLNLELSRAAIKINGRFAETYRLPLGCFSDILSIFDSGQRLDFGQKLVLFRLDSLIDFGIIGSKLFLRMSRISVL